MLWASIDAHSERCLIFIGVAVDHQGKVKGIETISFDSETDQAPSLFSHEIDLLWRRKLRGTNQISFVFAAFVIDHNNALAIPNGVQGIRDGVKDRIHTLGSYG
jgi:hypothetical protein